MEIELTIKNYRCFSDEKPARILIKPGFTAFLGINNSGKSSLLKFFYEFRNLFQQLSETGIITFANDMKTIRLVGGLKDAIPNCVSRFAVSKEAKRRERSRKPDRKG